MVAWRYDESVATCEQALALARAVGARPAEFLALRALGGGLAYLGRGDFDAARARSRDMAQLRVWLCAKGLRAQAELAGLARARRDDDAVRDRLGRAGKLLATARRAAAEAAAVTPNAAGWLALAEAEAERARGEARPEAWSASAATWERLEYPPVAAYCRWRQAEALVAAGASGREASEPLRQAHAVAARIGAKPLLRELELLAERARLEVAPPETASPDGRESLEELLGLTPREAEVLALLARGYTNREIAATLVISVRTAGVHVSHILRKLGAPNPLEAAAIAHRLAPPHARQPGSRASTWRRLPDRAAPTGWSCRPAPWPGLPWPHRPRAARSDPVPLDVAVTARPTRSHLPPAPVAVAVPRAA